MHTDSQQGAIVVNDTSTKKIRELGQRHGFSRHTIEAAVKLSRLFPAQTEIADNRSKAMARKQAINERLRREARGERS